MVDRIIMLLPEFGLQQSALINQFLIDTGLSSDLRVILAEYEKEIDSPWTGNKRYEKRKCLGVEALNEKADFYWSLKGTKELRKRIDKYRIENGRKY